MSGRADKELGRAKKALSTSLPSSEWKSYLSLLQAWFGKKINRDEFDQRARKLLASDKVALHNQFLLAILNKCQSLVKPIASRDSSSSRTRAAKVRKKEIAPAKPGFQHRFVAVDPLIFAQATASKMPSEQLSLNFCTSEGTLPDISLIHGRIYVAAWDYGLDVVHDDVIELVLIATKIALKRLITAALKLSTSFKTRDGVTYGFRAQLPNPYSPASERSTSSCSFSTIPVAAVSSEGASSPAARLLSSSDSTILTCRNLLDALQFEPGLIPSHVVHTQFIQRLFSTACDSNDSREEVIDNSTNRGEAAS